MLKEHINTILNESRDLLIKENRMPIMMITDEVTSIEDDKVYTNGNLCILTSTQLSTQDRITMLEDMLNNERDRLRELN